METKKPNFKPKIHQEWEVRFDEVSSTCWSAKSKEEAEKLGKRKAKELMEEWEKENSKETKQQQKYEFISYYMGNYVEALKKQLWHDTRNESVSKEVIELKKEFMKNLSKILSQKLRVVWHQSYMDDSTSYSFEEVKEDEEVSDR